MNDWTAAPRFTHLLSLSDERGLFEHSDLDTPRPEHGYCLDDVARALIVITRERERAPDRDALAALCLRFVERAVVRDGQAHNRMSVAGRFTDTAGTGDWWGRALWALGVAVSSGVAEARGRALRAFHRAASARSADLRAIAYAGLGAAEVLQARPRDRAADDLLWHALSRIDAGDGEWSWPEPRLRYANAVLPEALLAAGAALDDPVTLERGLRMLRFLVELETTEGRLSVTAIDGRGPGDVSPLFDQQPIEVAAIADACARAFDLTADSRWRDAVGMAWAWFTGDNDSRTPMYDPHTGAGYDGLTPTGRNDNRGAESTLAALSTYQQARRLRVHSRVPV